MTERVTQGESQLDEIARELQSLLTAVTSLAVARAAAHTAPAPSEASEPASTEQMRRMEGQLETGERRLGNQVQALQAIHRALLDISGSMQTRGLCSGHAANGGGAGGQLEAVDVDAELQSALFHLEPDVV